MDCVSLFLHSELCLPYLFAIRKGKLNISNIKFHILSFATNKVLWFDKYFRNKIIFKYFPRLRAVFSEVQYSTKSSY